MRQCWLECPRDRPFFSEIVQKLESTDNDEQIYVSFDDIASNYVFPPTAMTKPKLENEQEKQEIDPATQA